MAGQGPRQDEDEDDKDDDDHHHHCDHHSTPNHSREQLLTGWKQGATEWERRGQRGDSKGE